MKIRVTTDLSWLDDLSFDVTVGLAPGDGAINAVLFENWSIVHNPDLQRFDFTGFFGRFELSSLTPRAAPVTVHIDIKPGSFPNSINPRSKGVIPVAVLGSVDFDATQVSSGTVAFGPGAASPVRDGRIKDVNGDGFMDIVLHFRTEDSGLACGDVDAALTGETFGGERIAGRDSVRMVGCR